TRRWSEHATTRAVGSAANPHLSVRARRCLFEWHKFRVAHDPTLAGHGDPVRRFAVVIAATPLADRISICAATDPGIVSRPGRYRRQGPNEREPEDRDSARKSMRTRTHGIARKIASLGAAKSGPLQRICKLLAGRLLRLAVIGARLRYLAGIVSHEALRRLQRCSLLKLWKSPKAPKAAGRWHSSSVVRW